ncbi:hypothetical protein GCM10022224_002920 [Nonomuraea antimicrobica]|uniref:Uncharacterized protein n=1 Tax=Nonomuraea antimicrobica TaxID=561173 RepID=A0ABP7AZP9_9ACTN
MNRLRRLTRSALTFAMLITTAGLGLATTTGPAAAAAEDPKVGTPCTAADLGKRSPYVKSSTVTPTVTHFKTFYVTAGSVGNHTVTLQKSTVVTVTVGTSVTITSTFDTKVLGSVATAVQQTVNTSTATTDSESTAISWTFNAPGYYALYKGTRAVTGEYGSVNCGRVDKGDGTFATEWTDRPGGSYTTFTAIEEGAITCDDVVPAGTLMRLAQERLGCFGTAPRQEQETPAPEKQVSGEVVAPFAAPPGFTCEPGYYRVGTPDRLLNWWNVDGTNVFDLRGWSTSTRAMWTVCQGPVSNGMTEHVFINRQSGNCLTLVSGENANEGGRLVEDTCRTVDDHQRIYLYRDVPGSTKVGFQIKSTGFMIGQARVADRELVRQYSSGMADGTGTYILEKVA